MSGTCRSASIWNETSPVKAPLGDEFIYYRRAYLYPNGDLLVIYIASGDTPWGYGAARMTKDSELVWSYLGQAHHDFDVGADGKIYLLDPRDPNQCDRGMDPAEAASGG